MPDSQLHPELLARHAPLPPQKISEPAPGCAGVEYGRYPNGLLPHNLAQGLLAVFCVFVSAYGPSYGPLCWVLPTEVQVMPPKQPAYPLCMPARKLTVGLRTADAAQLVRPYCAGLLATSVAKLTSRGAAQPLETRAAASAITTTVNVHSPSPSLLSVYAAGLKHCS